MVKRKIMNGDEMRHNMRAFSDGGRTHPKCAFEDAVPMPPADTIVRCHGWLKIPRDSLPPDFHYARAIGYPAYYEETSHYFALVYDYVPRSSRFCYAMQENIDFFYYAGFTYWNRHPNNWRSGKLVDFGDLASPFRFRPSWYGPPSHATSEDFFGWTRELLGDETNADGEEGGGEAKQEEGVKEVNNGDRSGGDDREMEDVPTELLSPARRPDMVESR